MFFTLFRITWSLPMTKMFVNVKGSTQSCCSVLISKITPVKRKMAVLRLIIFGSNIELVPFFINYKLSLKNQVYTKEVSIWVPLKNHLATSLSCLDANLCLAGDRINIYVAEFQYHCIWWNTDLKKHVQISMKHEKPLPSHIRKQGQILQLNSVEASKT